MEKKIISRTRKLKSLLLWVAVFVFAISNIGSTVFAATTTNTGGGGSVQDASNATIKDQAYSYQAYIFLTRDKDRFTCGSLWAKDISPEDVGTAKWFKGTDTTRSGQILSPENGQADCNGGTGGWLGTALQLWGFSSGNYSDFLEAIGFKRQADGGYGEAPSDLVERSRKVIQNRYYGGQGPQFNAALAYRIYYENFMNGCQFDSALGPNPSKDNQSGPYVYKISVVSATGEVKTTYVKMKKGQTDRIVVGYDVGISNGSGFELSCSELASKLSETSLTAPYAAYVKAHPTDTAAPTGDKDGNPIGNTGAIVGANGNTDGCYNGLSVFGWILCPMLDLADGIYGFLRSVIFSMLAIPEISSSSSAGLQASWAAVRNVANTLLVLVALIMIASQIFNFSFIDAYTVKKVLPRLVIAAILIQLSWFLFTTMVELFNALGYGLNWLITAPFQQAAGGDIVDIVGSQSSGDVQAATLFAGTGAVVGGVALAFVALSPGGWLTLALVAIGVIVSIILVILTLVIRKLLIIALLVIAPIALVAWILPNTQKFWNTWWQLFSKLLIMFPLIALLFAAGQIFATITAQSPSSNSGAGGMKIILVIIAYFAPLFLIPATFKFAGGIFNSIVGSLNNVGGKVKKSGFGLRATRDAQKKYSDEAKAAVIGERAREKRQDLLSKGTGFSRARARMGMGVTGLGKDAGKYLDRERATGLARAEAKKNEEAAEIWKSIAGSSAGDELTRLQNEVSGATLGSQYNGQPVTPELHRQALLSSLQTKNPGAIDNYTSGGLMLDPSDGKWKPDPSKVFSAEEQKARQQTLTKLVRDGNFGAFDEQMPDVARTSQTDQEITSKGGLPKAVSMFHNLSKGDGGSRDRQKEVLDTIAHQAQGRGADGSASTSTLDTVTNKQAAASFISSFSGNTNLTPEHKARIAAELGPQMGGINIGAVLNSGGGLRVDYDAATNSYVVASSSTPPTP